MSGRFKRSISIILIYGKREEKLDNLFISCHSLERNLVAEEPRFVEEGYWKIAINSW